MTIDFLDSRYVFFFSCIDSVGDEMSQFLAAGLGPLIIIFLYVLIID